MVECHPLITEVAKSNDTVVCTENTSGVAKPANNKEITLRIFASVLLYHPNRMLGMYKSF